MVDQDDRYNVGGSLEYSETSQRFSAGANNNYSQVIRGDI